MKPAPAARGPDPHTVVHRRVSRDEERTRFACPAEFGRSGKGWETPGHTPCPDCAAAPPPTLGPVTIVFTDATGNPTPMDPKGPPPAPTRPRRTLPT